MRATDKNEREIQTAEKIICRQVQKQVFSEEFNALSARKSISKSSHIRKLTPYIDDEGLLRVNGRIDAAYCIPMDARRPICHRNIMSPKL